MLVSLFSHGMFLYIMFQYLKFPFLMFQYLKCRRRFARFFCDTDPKPRILPPNAQCRRNFARFFGDTLRVHDSCWI